ncbi:hypothetical protein BC629DRAFT_1440980 [Irpex lacteus]|nr:hypothetical protein BC629DRAFT_1440980 [Irpex lacteus]
MGTTSISTGYAPFIKLYNINSDNFRRGMEVRTQWSGTEPDRLTSAGRRGRDHRRDMSSEKARRSNCIPPRQRDLGEKHKLEKAGRCKHGAARHSVRFRIESMLFATSRLQEAALSTSLSLEADRAELQMHLRTISEL